MVAHSDRGHDPYSHDTLASHESAHACAPALLISAWDAGMTHSWQRSSGIPGYEYQLALPVVLVDEFFFYVSLHRNILLSRADKSLK